MRISLSFSIAGDLMVKKSGEDREKLGRGGGNICGVGMGWGEKDENQQIKTVRQRIVRTPGRIGRSNMKQNTPSKRTYSGAVICILPRYHHYHHPA
jgi:hypothetical protein